MCSRYALALPPDVVKDYFGHYNEMDYPPRYNISPTQPVAIVRLDHAKRREMALVRWGLIPSWAKDPARFSSLFNARAETAAEKASFRGSLRHRRCLVPATAYYEWSGPARKRQPYMLWPHGGGPMAFAGLWEHWLGADGSEIETMAILTVAANASVGRFHDRMPVIVRPDQFAAWLDVSSGRSNEAELMLKPALDGLLAVARVSEKLNSPRIEGHEAIEIIEQMLL